MAGLNRTFMELKHPRHRKRVERHQRVLIVPLWNWNIIQQLCEIVSILVLIVPLWNWNMVFDGKDGEGKPS